MKGGVSMAVTSILTACGGGSQHAAIVPPTPVPEIASRLNSDAVSFSDADLVSVSEGHTARVLSDHHDGMFFWSRCKRQPRQNASDRDIHTTVFNPPFIPQGQAPR